jgi:hypothetical protein
MDRSRTVQARRLLLYLLIMGMGISLSSMSLVSAQSTSSTGNTIQSSICGLLSTISSVIGILAIFLFVLGAILYAVAHILPSAGNLKGSTQGWGMGMLVGGVIMVILYLLSSFIIYKIASLGSNGPIPSIVQVNCNTVGLLGSTSGTSGTASITTGVNPTLSAANSGTSPKSTSGVSAASSTPSEGSINSQTAGGNIAYSNAYCQAGTGTVQINNGNFGSGSYSGWSASGLGFGLSPTDINVANENNDYYSTPWSNYNWEFFATTFRQNSTYTPGNLTSASFHVTEPFLNFKITSPQSSRLYLEILLNGRPFIVSYYNTTNGQGSYPLGTFANASINLGPLFCQNASIRIVSQVAGNQGNLGQFIAVGDFYLANQSIATPGILVNSTVV